MITPILIPVGSNSNSGPDNKCPKCGHEWDDESQPATLKSKIIITLIVVIGLYFLIGLLDCFNGGIMYNAIFVKSVENYEVPKGWEILVNDNGRYIVKIRGKNYLTRSSDIPKLTLSSYWGIDPPLKCTSEKRAKSTLKHYLDKKKADSFKKY